MDYPFLGMGEGSQWGADIARWLEENQRTEYGGNPLNYRGTYPSPETRFSGPEMAKYRDKIANQIEVMIKAGMTMKDWDRKVKAEESARQIKKPGETEAEWLARLLREVGAENSNIAVPTPGVE